MCGAGQGDQDLANRSLWDAAEVSAAVVGQDCLNGLGQPWPGRLAVGMKVRQVLGSRIGGAADVGEAPGR